MSHLPASPDELSLSDLERKCRRETKLYQNDQPNDPRFCLEIFRRALLLTTMHPEGALQDKGASKYVAALSSDREPSPAPLYRDESARTLLMLAHC
jgi:hypothetical protein